MGENRIYNISYSQEPNDDNPGGNWKTVSCIASSFAAAEEVAYKNIPANHKLDSIAIGNEIVE